MDTLLLAQLHETLYTHLDKRAEAIVGLIYALASNDHARSVVELSLHPLFRHGHASLYRAIDAFASQPVDLRRLAAVVAPRPNQRAFWLMSTDVTARPRPYARTLADRSYVYAPTPTPGQKPVKWGMRTQAGSSSLALVEMKWCPLMRSGLICSEFDHEHFFRFGKRHLLLTVFQTPDVRREEAWHRLVFLVYLFLWAARPIAQQRWRPWEKYLQAKGGRILSPTQVQRDFARIMRALELQPAKPKPRGKPPGRPTGYRQKPRERYSVVKKSSNRPTKRKKAA